MVEENPAQALERIAVVAAVADPEDAPVGEPDLRGALDLRDVEVDRVVDPEQHRRDVGDGAGLDLGAGGIGLEHAAPDPPRDLAPALLALHQVHRASVHRIGIAEAADQGPVQFGFVISGEQPGGGAVAEGDAIGGETPGEDRAEVVRRRPGGDLGAGALPLPRRAGERAAADRGVGGLARERAAGARERRERLAHRVRLPAGQGGEAHRLHRDAGGLGLGRGGGGGGRGAARDARTRAAADEQDGGQGNRAAEPKFRHRHCG